MRRPAGDACSRFISHVRGTTSQNLVNLQRNLPPPSPSRGQLYSSSPFFYFSKYQIPYTSYQIPDTNYSFLTFSVTQNSPKYFPRSIRVCESTAGIAPKKGAVIGTRNHCRNI